MRGRCSVGDVIGGMELRGVRKMLMMMMVMVVVVKMEAFATGGLRVAKADIAPRQGMRLTASRVSGEGVGAGCKPTSLTPPRGLRSGMGMAAPVTSLNNTRANAPLEPASR